MLRCMAAQSCAKRRAAHDLCIAVCIARCVAWQKAEAERSASDGVLKQDAVSIAEPNQYNHHNNHAHLSVHL